jgi:putative oxidoreductase
MMNPAMPTTDKPAFSAIGLLDKAAGLAEAIPLSLIQLAARIAIANVFWNSAQSKLLSWPITLQLFAMEYRVPLLPPEIAAPLATATELTGAILICVGLFTRLSALALLGLVAVIQIFVYPGHWGEHLLWASLLGLLLARGAGVMSLDQLGRRLILGKR